MDRYQSGDGKKRKELNNRGFTLVELLVVMAILSVVGGIVILFLQSGIHSYESTSKEVDMQYDAQVLLNQIESYVIGTNLGLAQKDDVVHIYNKDETGILQETLFWDSDAKTLSYEKRRESNGLETVLIPKTLLAENVEQFSMDISQAENEGKVTAQLELVKEEKRYSANAVWKLRNHVLSEEEVQEQYEVEKEKEGSLVTAVTVQASRNVLVPGEEQICYAKVIGGMINNVYSSQSVSWILEGEVSSGGTYIEQDGTLHTGEDEQAGEITVVAQSVEKPSVMGRLTIQLIPGMLELTPKESWVGVSGGTYDPHSYGKSVVDFEVGLKENQTIDLSKLSWECSRSAHKKSLAGQEDPWKKKIRLSSTESGGDIVVQVFAEDDEGRQIQSNQAVIHVVKMTANKSTLRKYTLVNGKDDGRSISTIRIADGFKELKEGDLQYASSFEDILYNRKNCRFYLYDAKEMLTFHYLKRDQDGAWTFTVKYNEKSSVWDYLFADPLAAYVAAGIYEAGTLEKKTDVVGDSYYYGFSVCEFKISK